MKTVKITPSSVVCLMALFITLPSCKKDPYLTKPTYTRAKNQQLQSDKTKQPKPPAPAVTRRTPRTLNFEELQIAKEYTSAYGTPAQTTIYLENMVKQCSDPNLLKEIYLELADLYFEQGNLEKAAKLYASYGTLYPGSQHRAYVHEKAILCKFYSTLSSDRDQTATEETFKLTQNFLTKAQQDTLYQEYKDDILAIQKQCCKKMYDHEIDVFNFYYKKGNYRAAQVHLDEMKKTYVALMDTAEPDLLALECSVAEKQGDTKLLLAKQTELQTKYPQLAALKLAAATPNKVDHVIRF